MSGQYVVNMHQFSSVVRSHETSNDDDRVIRYKNVAIRNKNIAHRSQIIIINAARKHTIIV